MFAQEMLTLGRIKIKMQKQSQKLSDTKIYHHAALLKVEKGLGLGVGCPEPGDWL